MARRVSEIELCFDSMTDLITNLAGGLILLVLLLFGVTRDAVSQAKPAPEPLMEEPGPADSGDRSTKAMQQRISELQIEVNAVETAIRRLEEPLRQAKQEAEELLRKVESIAPPPPKDEAKPEEPKAKTVEFRPPVVRISLKETAVLYICAEGRVSVLDLTELNAAFKAFVKTLGRIDTDTDKLFVLSSGDFDVHLRKLTLQAVRKQNHGGETVDKAQMPNSEYGRFLDRLDPREHVLQFAVYHDSFDTFRTVRKLAWDRGLELDWVPHAPGGPIMLGTGATSIQ